MNGVRALQARRIPTRIDVRGDLSDPSWAGAEWSPRFADMASGRPGLYDTRAAVLWDDTGLSVGFRVEEPFPTATLTERDALLFRENDLEVFVAFDEAYYELELNAINTVYEVLHVWRDRYAAAGFAARPEFALGQPGAYTFGGDFDRRPSSFWDGTHPRGPRVAFRNWDFPGLVTAVHVDGTINDETMVSAGWTAEVFLPWTGFAAMRPAGFSAPQVGDEWSIFLGRFQQVPIAHESMTAAWCVTPHGVYDTHQPERFTRLLFTAGASSLPAPS